MFSGRNPLVVFAAIVAVVGLAVKILTGPYGPGSGNEDTSPNSVPSNGMDVERIAEAGGRYQPKREVTKAMAGYHAGNGEWAFRDAAYVLGDPSSRLWGGVARVDRGPKEGHIAFTFSE